MGPSLRGPIPHIIGLLGALIAAEGCATPDRRSTNLTQASLDSLPLTGMGRSAATTSIVLGLTAYTVGRTGASDGAFWAGGLVGIVRSDGSAVVADRLDRRVVAIASTGRPAPVSRRGSGPGEIGFPLALLNWDGGEFGVLDTERLRLARFRTLGDVTTHLADYPLSIQPAAACATGGNYVGLGYQVGVEGVISVYTIEGRLLARFGPPFAFGPRSLMLSRTQGRLVCRGSPPRVIVAAVTGEMFSFELDGTFRWRKAIPDFEPGLVEATASTVLVGPLAKGADRSRLVISLAALSDSVGVVQLQEFLAPPDGHGPAPIKGRVLSKLFDLSSGRLLGEQDDIPKILDAATGFLLLEHGDEEPWVSAVRFKLTGTELTSTPIRR